MSITMNAVLNAYGEAQVEIDNLEKSIGQSKDHASKVFLQAAQEHYLGSDMLVEYKGQRKTEDLPEDLCEFLDWCKAGEDHFKDINKDWKQPQSYKNMKSTIKRAWLLSLEYPELAPSAFDTESSLRKALNDHNKALRELNRDNEPSGNAESPVEEIIESTDTKDKELTAELQSIVSIFNQLGGEDKNALILDLNDTINKYRNILQDMVPADMIPPEQAKAS